MEGELGKVSRRYLVPDYDERGSVRTACLEISYRVRFCSIWAIRTLTVSQWELVFSILAARRFDANYGFRVTERAGCSTWYDVAHDKERVEM